MSLRLDLIGAARRAPRLLGEATDTVAAFFAAAQRPDGGFADRAGRSDLYYAAFGAEALEALGRPWNKAAAAAFARDAFEPDRTDLPHLWAWIRLLKAAGEELLPAEQRSAREILERFRSRDGGYDIVSGGAAASAYGLFLACGALQDLGLPLGSREQWAACLDALKTRDGGYRQRAGESPEQGAANPAAAALTVRRELGLPPDEEGLAWLLAQERPRGGFRAAPQVPMPDLLSTAAAIHALGVSRADLTPLRERTLDFLDSLWDNLGGFHGHWADPVVDCEYTYYGLVVLGWLAGPDSPSPGAGKTREGT